MNIVPFKNGVARLSSDNSAGAALMSVAGD